MKNRIWNILAPLGFSCRRVAINIAITNVTSWVEAIHRVITMAL